MIAVALKGSIDLPPTDWLPQKFLACGADSASLRFADLPCLASGGVEDLSHGNSPWDAAPPTSADSPTRRRLLTHRRRRRLSQDFAENITPIVEYWKRELQSDYWPKRTRETGGYDA